jgi:hypothetical protein
MNTETLLFDVALAVAFFLIVNLVGRSSEGLGYTTFLANLEQSSFGFNSLFRVFAPAILTGLTSLALYAVGLGWMVADIWLATVFYWAIRLIYYVFRDWWELIPRGIFLTQAGISIGLTYYFYVNAYSKGIQGILPQPTDVTFQFWLVVLGFGYLWLNHNAPTERIVRSKRERLLRRHEAMQARFDRLLGVRYQQDVVLRALFYTIMLVEDFNRSRTWRVVERLLAGLGLAHTTGIMQVTADRPLSDEASVLRAQDIVAELWDDTISERVAAYKTTFYPDGEQLVLEAVTPLEYHFSYVAMMDFAHANLPDIYTTYSGNLFEGLDDFFDVVAGAAQKGLADDVDFVVTVVLPKKAAGDTQAVQGAGSVGPRKSRS